MANSPIIGKPKLKPIARQLAIPSMQLAGLTQVEMADHLGVSLSTVKNDLEEIRPNLEQVRSIMQRAQSKLESIWPIEKRIERIADLGEKAKNEAVSLGAVQMANDIAGIVTQKELVRTRRDEQHNTPGPMFILQPGVSVNVTVNEQDVRNVTPMNIQSDDEQKG